MVTFILAQSREKLTGQSGLALLGRLLDQTPIRNLLGRVITPKQKRDPKIEHADIVVSYMGLLAQGKSDFEAIEDFRDDEFFKLALDLNKVPSSSRLRQRLDQLGTLTGKADLKPKLKEESARLLSEKKVTLTPTLNELVALDLDVSPYDNSRSKKEGVGRTYKGFDGYSPMFAYLGLEGYQINAELRPGKQHCQNGTPAFLSETLRLARLVTDAPLVVRMDSGNDAGENLFILEEAQNVDYIIKRNIRREDKNQWLEKAKKIGVADEVRAGKTVYRGWEKRIKTKKVDKKKKEYEIICLFEVTHRTTDHEGKALEEEIIEVESYWTSLPKSLEEIKDQYHQHEQAKQSHEEQKKQILPILPADQQDQASSCDQSQEPEQEEEKKVENQVKEVVDQYHHHGTSEQYHSEQKTDMNLERLPSGYFETNHLILIMGLFIYNILRIIGQTANSYPKIPLRKSATRRRLGTVIKNLIYVPARLVRHARRIKLSFGAHCAWFKTFEYVYHQLAPQ